MKPRHGLFTTEFWLVVLALAPDVISNFLELYKSGTANLDRGDLVGLGLVGLYTLCRTAVKYVPIFMARITGTTEPAPETPSVG